MIFFTPTISLVSKSLVPFLQSQKLLEIFTLFLEGSEVHGWGLAKHELINGRIVHGPIAVLIWVLIVA